MYEERKISIKDIIIQLILVVLFVLIIIWLFPTKNYLADTYATKNDIKSVVDEALDSKLEFLYGRNFADNIATMQAAATNYFTDSRMPKNIGDSVTITLDEMLSKKLLVLFKDSNNKTCDLEDSYVKVTKMDDEYEMKVKLSCSDYSDYVLVYLGCHDYCNTCDKKTTTTTTTNTSNNNKKPTPTPTPTVAKQYKYRLTTQNEYSGWSACSGYTTTPIKNDELTKVNQKQVDVLTGYQQTWGIVGYTQVTKTTNNKVTTPTTKTEYADPIKSTTAGYWSDWKYQGYVTSTYALSTYYDSTSTVKYTYVSDKTTIDCSSVCKNVTTYTYKKETRSYIAGSTTSSCPSGFSPTNDGRCYKTVSGSTTTNVPTTTTEYEPQYGYINGAPIYNRVTYYCSMTRKLINEASTIYKTSSSANDQSLLDLGYVLIGEV